LFGVKKKTSFAVKSSDKGRKKERPNKSNLRAWKEERRGGEGTISAGKKRWGGGEKRRREGGHTIELARKGLTPVAE